MIKKEHKMRKLFFILQVVLVSIDCVWAGDCCKDAWIPELCNPTICRENKKEDQNEQQQIKKLYYGQYNACLRALKNAENQNKINISYKQQLEYCECIAEQMVERIDLKAMGNFIAVGMPASALSLVEFNLEATMSICETKLNIHILP